MADLPEIKNPRYREVERKKGRRVKRIAQVFLVPGPNADKYPNGPDAFMCPAGPGLGPIPRSGRWYDVTDYLLRRMRDGDAAEGVPSSPAPKAKPKKAKE